VVTVTEDGSVRLHPALSEMRLTELTLHKLLSGIDLGSGTTAVPACQPSRHRSVEGRRPEPSQPEPEGGPVTRLRRVARAAAEPEPYAADELWLALRNDLSWRHWHSDVDRVGLANTWIELDSSSLSVPERIDRVTAFIVSHGVDEHEVAEVIERTRERLAEPGYSERRRQRDAMVRLLAMGA
jgi:hypothetical protein